MFYILKYKKTRFGTRWAYGEFRNPVEFGDAPRCPVCGKRIGGREWLYPQHLHISSSKPEKWGDFLWDTEAFPLISAHVKAVYEAEGLTGIEKIDPPAKIVSAGRWRIENLTPPVSLPEYFHIKIKWNAANLDDTASNVVREFDRFGCDFCRGSIATMDQAILESGSWDGSDIFEARGLYGTVVVSQRFHDIAQAHGFTDIEMIPAEKYAYDEHRPGLWYVKE